MTDPLPIPPIRHRLRHDIRLPGSKSITNRALILAALSEGTVCLEGVLFSRDTRIMLEALRQLGFSADADEAAGTVRVDGAGGAIPAASATLRVGNAGTAARFLPALAARRPGGEFHFDGDPAMRRRPMKGLLDALRALGAAEVTFHGETDHFPFTLRTKGYRGGDAEVDARESSQILSALLLSAADAEPVRLTAPSVRRAYVAITLRMREAFGAAPAAEIEETGEDAFRLPATRYAGPAEGRYRIEPDVSAAGYFLALALILGGGLRIPGLGPRPLQGDAHFLDVLRHHGLEADADGEGWVVEQPGELSDAARDDREIDFNTISDTFLTYAAITPLLGGAVRITGIGHTRKQETDRVAGMAAELAKLGQQVREEPDALVIRPDPAELLARAQRAREAGACLEVETYEDHRFAMSFAILACFDLLGDGAPWLAIRDPDCCAKTFPAFFDCLDSLRREETAEA